MSKKLLIKYDDGDFEQGEFKIFTFKEIKEFPGDVIPLTNIAVIVFSEEDLQKWKDTSTTDSVPIPEDDYRWVQSASSDGKYIELADMGYAYMKKNRNAVFVHDPCGEMEDKWNMLSYKKED